MLAPGEGTGDTVVGRGGACPPFLGDEKVPGTELLPESPCPASEAESRLAPAWHRPEPSERGCAVAHPRQPPSKSLHCPLQQPGSHLAWPLVRWAGLRGSGRCRQAASTTCSRLPQLLPRAKVRVGRASRPPPQPLS